ncbi:hypothetical protein [uncultured Enterococcus sp.]|uniref:hypothetical protein n=1 Tax=uncultured Enterococcus sp. TaxID=167972 RepID=UPI002AA7E307|nr:hypothetical protein [uncultured Enterococcus sp.]
MIASKNEEYFILEIKYNQKKYYSIWISDDQDSLITENEKITLFSDMLSLKKYCERKRLSLEEGISEYDIDKLVDWINEKISTVDVSFILDFWNIFMDVSNSVKELFVGNEEKYSDLYRKLFYGNNLPTINTSENDYIPVWNEHEVDQIKNIMKDGLKLFRENTIVYNLADR